MLFCNYRGLAEYICCGPASAIGTYILLLSLSLSSCLWILLFFFLFPESDLQAHNTYEREREREYEQGKDSAFEVELQRAFYLTS